MAVETARTSFATNVLSVYSLRIKGCGSTWIDFIVHGHHDIHTSSYDLSVNVETFHTRRKGTAILFRRQIHSQSNPLSPHNLRDHSKMKNSSRSGPKQYRADIAVKNCSRKGSSQKHEILALRIPRALGSEARSGL